MASGLVILLSSSGASSGLGEILAFFWVGMQSQLVCSGCRTILLYPRGAYNVSCALCNVVTAVPSPEMDLSQLICGGCRTLLTYTRGATSVRCLCCHTVSLVPAPNHQVAHINCGNCRTTLMYPYGSQSVRCATCHHVTYINIGNTSIPATSEATPATSTCQTVIVQNPATIDESGKPVSNVVVGITS